MRSLGKKIVFSLIIFFVFLELGAMFLSRGLNKFSPPNFVYNTTPKGLDINPLFGVWHLPNSVFRQKQRCLDVEYRFNSFGARDFDRPAKGSKRVIALGDSFIEGYGIDTFHRMTNILENQTDYKFINLGTSGGFGSTQMHLSYQYFKDSLEHDKVLIGLFPTNDFNDDNYQFGSIYYPHRYRPYHIPVADSDSFQLIYHVKDISESNWSMENYDSGLNSRFAQFLNAYTHFGSVLRQVWISKQRRLTEQMIENALSEIDSSNLSFNKRRIAHKEFTDEEYNLLIYNLRKIKELAGDKAVYVFTIAAKFELRHLSHHPESMILNSRLKEDLDSLGITFIDVVGAMARDIDPGEYNRLYLECDGHWSAYGNEVAANKIIEYFTD